MTDPTSLLLLCRPGFEKECLAEITQVAAEHGHYGWAQPEADSGWLQFHTEQASRLYAELPALVFTREAWPVLAHLDALPASDRTRPIADALQDQPAAGQLFCDTAEGDAYRGTARFAGKFVHPLRQALRQQNLLTPKDRADLPAWHALFLDSSRVLLGRDNPAHRPRWPMGVARLRFPPQAPSRSTLKLEEALHIFLGDTWRQQLQQSFTAADLGAAPGGWTWQLVKQGLQVQAIDNGPMDDDLMASGQVEHLRVDGFTWVPEHPVDWLVCDMVESPARVAERMLDWLTAGWCRNAVFNLKLPMKKRWQTWQDIEQRLHARLSGASRNWQIQARQLYFDRAEITVCIRPGT
ncbi:23S rRNA (cytidine(2498)-2'-O)-methyltransferase RlmM [Natronospirillum operosum]|uniref:23S rRNA (Cytidine(2498)-2'-O)-methyltransferase RlmM n=1 Tax=Natronospirillum operosum TaxID=2759953 RepID=A0A4Z0WC50_9GAMM|nr:23S rRNA (cytidine(2498)-2'-O)-methyltransferase RlmM [Natronospirillum operosum]TGG94115.1 23S rRNA (cytidine(2498)-2'-O)-methyltransferase RlmM [Natronospirillum operosum]